MSLWLLVRRPLDRLVAVALLLVAAPLLGLAGIAVRLVDGPPMFIQVPRVGHQGRTFGMLKVRTMRPTTPARGPGSRSLSGRGDERVTSIGRHLRRWRLDELPQLVNVIRGEMALLGPRPEAPDFVDDSVAWRHVLRARPGIAGPTQVMVHRWEATIFGGPEFDGTQAEADYRHIVLPVKLAIDRWYVDHASPRIDLMVLGALLPRIVGSRSRKTLAAETRRSVPESAVIPTDA